MFMWVKQATEKEKEEEEEVKKIQQPHNSLLDEYAGWPWAETIIPCMVQTPERPVPELWFVTIVLKKKRV